MVSLNVTGTALGLLTPQLREQYYALVEKYWEAHDQSSDALVWGAVVVYLAMVFLLPSILAPFYKNPAYKVLTFLTKVFGPIWNLLLCAYSFIAIVGVFDLYQNRINAVGLDKTLCDEDRYFLGDKELRFWVFTFAFSKFAELVDTLFLIIKNPTRKVAFLHWYHHFTVLLFTWYALKVMYTSAIPFFVINATVHTVMYGYYFFKEIGITPPGAIIITSMQIIQMVLGIIVNVNHAIMLYKQGRNCSGKNPEIIIGAAAIMYGSYLFLFVQFFVRRYFGPAPAHTKKNKSD